MMRYRGVHRKCAGFSIPKASRFDGARVLLRSPAPLPLGRHCLSVRSLSTAIAACGRRPIGTSSARLLVGGAAKDLRDCCVAVSEDLLDRPANEERLSNV